MIVGLPKEIKNNEHRVGLTPDSVSQILQTAMKYLLKLIVEKKLALQMKNMKLLVQKYLIQLPRFMKNLSWL